MTSVLTLLSSTNQTAADCITNDGDTWKYSPPLHADDDDSCHLSSSSRSIEQTEREEEEGHGWLDKDV